MPIPVRYERPGYQTFTGQLIGASPCTLGVLFVRRDDTGTTVAVDGEFLSYL
jgi:hypothetical protein